MSLRAAARTSGRRSEEGRRRHEDNIVEIRKSRREESLLKKRCDGLPAAAGAPQMGHSSAPPAENVGLIRMIMAVKCNGADTPGVTSKKEKAWKDPNKPPQEGRVYASSTWSSRRRTPKNKSVAAASS